MCNVILLRFSCHHSLRLRRSSCKGTKHKITRNGAKAACTAVSFLTISLQSDCSTCQHATWEQEWATELERAHIFLSKLTEKRIPGIDEVTILVKELKEKHAAETWNTRYMFAHAQNRSVARVNISDHRTARSPLAQEVKPEDVVESEKEKDWTDMDEADYDSNYVASTDPIHPVSTDYSHPLDDDDGSWILNHLSSEELDSSDTHDEVDFEGNSWNWGNDESEDATSSNSVSWSQEFHDDARQRNGTEIFDTYETGLTWASQVESTSPVTQSTTENPITTTTIQATATHSKQIEQVIAAFWDVVHNTTHQDRTHHTSQQATNPIPLLSTLAISPTPSDTSSVTSSAPTTPRAKSSPIWTDGATDTPTPSSPLQATTPPPPPLLTSPNSTRARFNKQRRYLNQRVETDGNTRNYYSDWLLVSRYEARAFEGPEGRKVVDPPVLRSVGGGGGNGWWR